jgi:uncharacterized protein (TIGR04255 family)
MAPDLIVHYGEAPVAEVVLAVQFAESAIDLDVLAEFSRGVRDAFPKREQHEPLVPSREDLAEGGAPVSIEFQVVQEFPFPRTWFASDDGHRLLQLQADRLIFNWRKLDDDDEEYPHYDGLRPIFEENLHRLRECFHALGRPQPTANLTEVSYVNFVAVPDSEPGAGHPGLHRILRDICSPQEGGFLPPTEDQAYLARYRIPHWDNPETPAGRLYVSAQPAYRNRDRMPIYTVKLTTNLVPAFPDDKTILRALDWGREWAVRSFDLITQPEMQDAWKREEVET